MGNKDFYRVGAYGHWFINKVDFYTFFMHGYDNVFLGNGVPSNQASALPLGAAAPTWNGGFIEGHYNPTPRLKDLYRPIRIDPYAPRQANCPGIRSNAGNIDNWTLGLSLVPDHEFARRPCLDAGIFAHLEHRCRAALRPE